MTALTQIIIGVITGIVSLGLLIFLFRHIFDRLDKKLDITVFEEYAKRIADKLDAGGKRLDKIDNGLGKISDQILNLSVTLEKNNKT